MKKICIIATITTVALIAGGYFSYTNTRQSAIEQNRAEQNIARSRTTTESAPVPSTNQPGRYIEYKSGVIGQTAGQKILFFHAPWCPQCRSLDKSIRETTLPSGVTIIKVDYDSNQELRKEYGVTLQTTLVKVNNAGQLIEKYVAYNEPNYAAVRAALLE